MTCNLFGTVVVKALQGLTKKAYLLYNFFRFLSLGSFLFLFSTLTIRAKYLISRYKSTTSKDYQSLSKW